MMHSTKRLAAAISLSLALAFAASAAGALDRPEEMREMATEWFDILYPSSCAASARYLASFADETYALVATALRVPRERRLVVAFTSSYDMLNGSFSPVPSSRILLYQANIAPDDELGSQADDLRILFLHELTHAVSLTMASPAWKAVAFLVGDIVGPAGYLVGTGAMSEGVTVSFESSLHGSDREGRANDPWVAARLLQDLLEDRAPDFWQASGARDLWPHGSAKYRYGGLFSAWLRSTWGDESYARLWAVMAEGDLFAGVDGWPLGPGAFERVYGEKLDTLWSRFLDSLRVRDAVVPAAERVDAAFGSIRAISASRDAVYWADGVSKRLLRYDPAALRVESLADLDGYVNALDVSADGKLLLVSTSYAGSGFDRYVVREYDLSARRWTGREWPGLRDACWQGSGSIAAVMPRGYECDIVELSVGTDPIADRIAVLVRGDHLRSFASLDSSPDGALWFLAHDESGFWIGRGRSGGDGFSVERLAADGLSWPRAVTVDPDGLAWIAYCPPGSLPRLARHDADGLALSPGMMSGGAWIVAGAGDGRVWAVSRFSGGDRVTRPDPGNPALAPTRSPSSWIPMPREAFERPSPYDEGAFPPLPSRPLAGFARALGNFRLPALEASSSPFGPFESAGIAFYGGDPYGEISWTASFTWNWFVGAPELALALAADGFELALSDAVDWDPRSWASRWYRIDRVAVGFSGTTSLDVFWRVLGWNAYAAAVAASPDPGDGSFPLSWPASLADAAAGFRVGYSDLRFDTIESRLFSGIAASAALDADLSLSAGSDTPRLTVDGSATLAWSALGLTLRGWGQLSLDGRTAFAPAYRYRLDTLAASAVALGRPAWNEFADASSTSTWLACFDARVTPLVAEIQSVAFPLLYLNHFALSGGVRGVFFDSASLFSTYLRFELGFSVLRARLAEGHPLLWFEIAFPFASFPEAGFDWGFSLPL